MKVSVVIPTLNRLSIFEKCLERLLSQSFSLTDYEIIIVDDGSTDDTQRYCENIVSKYVNVKYIRNQINQGRVLSRNNGILASQGEIIIMLDNDNVPCREFVEAHFLTHQIYEKSHVAVLGKVCYENELIKASNFGKFIQSRAIGFRSVKDMKGIDMKNMPPKFFASGNSSVHKEDLLKVGLYDTDFRHYGGEDEFLGFKLNQNGVSLVYNENALSIHHDDISPFKWKIKYLETGNIALKVLVNKNTDYLLGTNVKWLLPIQFKNDSVLIILLKFSLRLFLNRILIKLVEIYAFKTDKLSIFYFPKLYYFLIAGWVFQGFKSKKNLVKVQY